MIVNSFTIVRTDWLSSSLHKSKLMHFYWSIAFDNYAMNIFE